MELTLATREVLVARLAVVAREAVARSDPVRADLASLKTELTSLTAYALTVFTDLTATHTLSLA